MRIEKTATWQAGGGAAPAWVKALCWSFVLAGLGLLAGGFFAYRSAVNFAESALSAEGEVIDLSKKYIREKEGGRSMSYAPVVKFIDRKGDVQEFESRTSSNPPSYRRGDKVVVLYEADNPEFSIIDDWNRYLSFLVLSGMGVVFFTLGLLVLWISTKAESSDDADK